MPGGIGLRCGGMDVSIQGLDRVLESEDLVAKHERDRFRRRASRVWLHDLSLDACELIEAVHGFDTSLRFECQPCLIDVCEGVALVGRY